jgi:hypothetical protein
MKRAAVALLLAVPVSNTFDADTIMRAAVVANARDLAAAAQFDHVERRQTPDGSKTYAVTLIEGSPYSQLVAVDDQPLPEEDRAREEQKMKATRASRARESASERQRRLADYAEERDRTRLLLTQMTDAFEFSRERDDRIDNFDAYVVRANPRPTYRPPSREAAVLRGVESRFWVEQNSMRWIRIEASVVRPVSIASFLASVEPGTQFTLEQSPVGDDIWAPKHFVMRARGRLLLLFNKRAQLDMTYFGYRRLPVDR